MKRCVWHSSTRPKRAVLLLLEDWDPLLLEDILERGLPSWRVFSWKENEKRGALVITHLAPYGAQTNAD